MGLRRVGDDLPRVSFAGSDLRLRPGGPCSFALLRPGGVALPERGDVRLREQVAPIGFFAGDGAQVHMKLLRGDVERLSDGLAVERGCGRGKGCQ